MSESHLSFFKPNPATRKMLHLVQEGISAGFPSPADDFKELRISIDQEVVKNEEATFYARVSGQSMQGAGLDDGDLLVIDRSQVVKIDCSSKVFLISDVSTKQSHSVFVIKVFIT